MRGSRNFSVVGGCPKDNCVCPWGPRQTCNNCTMYVSLINFNFPGGSGPTPNPSNPRMQCIILWNASTTLCILNSCYDDTSYICTCLTDIMQYGTLGYQSPNKNMRLLKYKQRTCNLIIMQAQQYTTLIF